MIPKSERINAAYEAWFKQLQALTSVALDPDDWTGRWHHGYRPADALEEGPDEDAHNELLEK